MPPPTLNSEEPVIPVSTGLRQIAQTETTPDKRGYFVSIYEKIGEVRTCVADRNIK